MLACAGSDKIVRILDWKEKKVVKELITLHRGNFIIMGFKIVINQKILYEVCNGALIVA